MDSQIDAQTAEAAEDSSPGGGSNGAIGGIARSAVTGAIARSRLTGSAARASTRSRLGPRVMFLLVVAAGIALPYVGVGDYILQISGDALALGIWVMGLDFLAGYTGRVSFGHAVWLAVGGYASGYLFLHGWDAITAALATIGIVAVLSAVMGAIATRTGGLAFAIITLAEGVVIYTIIIHLTFIGGGVGLFGEPLPKIAGQSLLNGQQSLYNFALALACLSYLGLRWLLRSPAGGFCQAIRDDETRARSIGVEVQRHQILAFIAASVVGAIGGIAFVVLNGGVAPNDASWSQSALALVMLIIGGMGTLYGAFIGAFIYVFAQNYLTSTAATTWEIYLGGLFVAIVLLLPGGVAGGLRLAFTKMVSRSTRWLRRPPTVPDVATRGTEVPE